MSSCRTNSFFSLCSVILGSQGVAPLTSPSCAIVLPTLIITVSEFGGGLMFHFHPAFLNVRIFWEPVFRPFSLVLLTTFSKSLLTVTSSTSLLCTHPVLISLLPFQSHYPERLYDMLFPIGMIFPAPQTDTFKLKITMFPLWNACSPPEAPFFFWFPSPIDSRQDSLTFSSSPFLYFPYFYSQPYRFPQICPFFFVLANASVTERRSQRVLLWAFSSFLVFPKPPSICYKTKLS